VPPWHDRVPVRWIAIDTPIRVADRARESRCRGGNGSEGRPRAPTQGTRGGSGRAGGLRQGATHPDDGRRRQCGGIEIGRRRGQGTGVGSIN